MDNIDVSFCRRLLSVAHSAVKKHFPDINLRKDAWVWNDGMGGWEFHGPEKFYWHGDASNAYDARYKGWMAWLEYKQVELPEENDNEDIDLAAGI